MILYKCSKCNLEQNNLIQNKDLKEAKNKLLCPLCQEETLVRQLGAPASASKKIIDQPGMAKAVEINLDVIKDNKERSKKEPNRDY